MRKQRPATAAAEPSIAFQADSSRRFQKRLAALLTRARPLSAGVSQIGNVSAECHFKSNEYANDWEGETRQPFLVLEAWFLPCCTRTERPKGL
jgi:hypothetical protein